MLETLYVADDLMGWGTPLEAPRVLRVWAAPPHVPKRGVGRAAARVPLAGAGGAHRPTACGREAHGKGHHGAPHLSRRRRKRRTSPRVSCTATAAPGRRCSCAAARRRVGPRGCSRCASRCCAPSWRRSSRRSTSREPCCARCGTPPPTAPPPPRAVRRRRHHHHCRRPRRPRRRWRSDGRRRRRGCACRQSCATAAARRAGSCRSGGGATHWLCCSRARRWATGRQTDCGAAAGW